MLFTVHFAGYLINLHFVINMIKDHTGSKRLDKSKPVWRTFVKYRGYISHLYYIQVLTGQPYVSLYTLYYCTCLCEDPHERHVYTRVG